MTPTRRRRLPWKKNRLVLMALVEAQHGLCRWCEQPIRQRRMRPPLPPDTATVDHIVPLSRGGTNERGNMVAACHGCNQRRNVQDMKRQAQAKRRRGMTTVLRGRGLAR